MLLQTGLLLAAAAATSPPFKTVVGLRPAARGLQEECPVLTKIKKDDCTDVKDFDALPVCRRRLPLSQSVFGPFGPRRCLPLV